MIATLHELRVLTLSVFIVSLFVVVSLFSPLKVQAFPFGGQITDLIHCINGVTYVTLSAPNPGPYIWSPATQTYDFGPPSHDGQWLLGLAGVPSICIVSVNLFFVDTRVGSGIMMMGSSQ